MTTITARLRDLDTRLLTSFRIRNDSGLAARIALWATRSADGPPYAAVAVAALFLAGADALAVLAVWGSAFVVERVLYLLLKRSLRRPRPFETYRSIRALVVPPDRFSFPSGHTSAAFLVAGLLSASAPVLSVPLLTWACAVGASRVSLGVHYPSDVVAGGLLGTALARLAGTFL